MRAAVGGGRGVRAGVLLSGDARFAPEAFERLAVAGEGALDHLGGQSRAEPVGVGCFVPFAGVHEGLEVLADELFVEADLGAAGFPLVGGPVAAGVRRECFVDEHEVARVVVVLGVGWEAELEFGVGEDAAALGGVVVGGVVDVEADLSGVLHDGAADDPCGVVEGDVLVVLAVFGFGGWCEDGFGEAVAPSEVCGEGDAADGAGLLVFAPARAVEVSPDDALDGDDARGAGDADAAFELSGLMEREPPFACGGRLDVPGDGVGWCELPLFDEAEPSAGGGGEQPAFARDRRPDDDIEGADAVGGNDEEGCGVVALIGGGGCVRGGGEAVDIADLAASEDVEGEACGRDGGHAAMVSGRVGCPGPTLVDRWCCPGWKVEG